MAVSNSWGYAEDITTDKGAHSTFHYELVRTLARAAGFCENDADMIAVANQTTDVGKFQGELGFSLQLKNTERISSNGMYWHEARRGCTNVTGQYFYPTNNTSCNTCDYFINTDQACVNNQPEVTGIENWAVYGANTLAPPNGKVPTFSTNGGRTFRPVVAKSLIALGIYLHAMEDSYSHEECMKNEQFRAHKPSPTECNGQVWHIDEEYGSTGLGVNYTINAGIATWRALNNFRTLYAGTNTPLWDEPTAKQFITEFAFLDAATDRRDKALTAFQALGNCP
jgi:hypothetical protein